MAMFKEGDYVFLPSGGPRARIEKVVQDDAIENLVIYFIVLYDRGCCGCIKGEGLRKDYSGLPSDKVADEEIKKQKALLLALNSGLERARSINPGNALKVTNKIQGIENKIEEIERFWRPKYHASGFQPFRNLALVHDIVYTKSVLSHRPDNFYSKDFYYIEQDGARIAVNSKNDGMEFVILMEDPETILVGTVGHSPMAKGKPVIFAGHVFFNGLSQLIKWNNNTGHYKTVQQYAHQAASVKDINGYSLLPIEKYVNLK